MKNLSLKRISLFASSFVFLSQLGLASNYYDTLTLDQKDELATPQKQVMLVEMDGNDWPVTTIYQIVNVSPREAVAIFSDYKEQPKYLQDTIGEAIPTQDPRDPASSIVSYKMNLPSVLTKIIGINPAYTLKDTMSQDAGSGSYSVSWTLLSSESVKSLNGEVTFEPLANASGVPQTLVRHHNSFALNPIGWVTDRIVHSGMAKGKMEEVAKHALRQTVEYMEAQQSNNTHEFQENLARIDRLFPNP